MSEFNTELYRGQRLLGQNSPLVLDLLQHLGQALWHVQLLEGSVAQYLVIVHQIPVGTAQEQAEAAFEAAEKQTLGGLISRIRSHGAPQALLDELEAFVEERNWLVHRIHGQYWGSARNAGVSATLIQRLDGIADDSLRISKLFVTEVERSLLAQGVPRQFLEQAARRIVEDVRAGKPAAGRRGFKQPEDRPS